LSMSNNEEFIIEEINRIMGEYNKFCEEIRPSVIEQVRSDPSLKNASDDEIYAKYEEIMDNHEHCYVHEHLQDIEKYYDLTRQRIAAIEEKALRTLAARRLPKDPSEEEINAKMEEVSNEQKKITASTFFSDYEEDLKNSQSQEKKEILLLLKKGNKDG